MISPAIQIDPPIAAATLTARPREATSPFAEHLAKASPDVRAVARKAAEEFVAAAFLEPLLAQVREGSMAVEPFAPTAAERRFGPLLDQRIAHNVVRGAKFPLVDRIEQQILQKTLSGGTSHVA